MPKGLLQVDLKMEKRLTNLGLLFIARPGKSRDMFKLAELTVLLLILASGLAGADTFKCKLPNGTIIFTNDPSQAPADCQIEKVGNLPPLGVIPDAPPQPAPTASTQKPGAPPAQDDGTKSFDVLRTEATALVEQFQSARHRLIHSSFAADQLKARRELAGIREQKTNLQSEIAQSSLSVSEKQEINDLLSAISE
jgi:hypothetical protein